jgi:hypothetical protein
MIPAMNIGFFIGFDVEQYRMSLYKVKARIWVALGLNDFMSSHYLNNYLNHNQQGQSHPDHHYYHELT